MNVVISALAGYYGSNVASSIHSRRAGCADTFVMT